jgi:hypothetical protein
MRTHRFKALLLFAGVLLVGTGCTDTLTEPKSTITEANVFTNLDAYRSFLAKLYAGLVTTGQEGPAGQADIQGIDEGFSQYVRGLWQLQTLPTDEAVIGWGDAGLPELNTQLWAATNQFVNAFYARIFFQITQANEFLRQSTDEKLAERGQQDLASTLRQFRAEARFLRALSYWHGLDLFGDIPLVDETFPIGATPPDQSTREQIYSFVLSELEEIGNELPLPGAAQYGRADQGALSMLLAKLYMNAEVYTGGSEYANAIIELDNVISGPYELMPVYGDNFLADNHRSPEFIFAVPQDGTHTRTWGGTTFLSHAALGGAINAADFGLDFAWWGLRVTPDFVGLFPGGADSPDGRTDIFFTEGQTLEIGSVSNFTEGYAAPKYRNVTSTGAMGSHPTFPDVDFPMFRLADAYLMYAEATLRGGGGFRDQALAYVNALRTRAYGDASGNITDSELTLDFILDERARELFWEAHRRVDLVRYGQFTTDGVWAWKGGVQQGQTTAEFRNLYPLPSNEILANPNLTQNSGY